MTRDRHPRPEPTLKERRLGLIIHFVIYLLVNIGLAALNLTRNPQHLWFYWVAIGWGAGVIGHAAAYFARSRASRAEPGNS